VGYTRPPRVYPPSPYGGAQTEDPAEVYKRNAVNRLVEVVHADISGIRKAREGDMDALFNAQAVLRHRGEEINRGHKELIDEKEALEQQLQMVLMNGDVLESWLRDNQAKIARGLGGHAIDVDDAFDCVDALSKQMVECAAADLAIEDVVYSLDKAAQDGVMPFDQYLRTVRLLSREQFFHRATAAKVRAAQMQAQVANMASRISHFGGDTEQLHVRA
jgi:ESCRT-I complex subunit TSG101